MRRRRYCSVECRQRLRRKMNARTGLLRALGTRYAAFYFTETVIVLDVLPHHSERLYSFVFPRTHQRPPAHDFCQMCDLLGSLWWDEHNRSRRRYRASGQVLARAHRNRPDGRIQPLEQRSPAVGSRALIRLHLGREDLESPERLQRLKQAFRRQAKSHHPDLGGSDRTFRKVVSAYEELLRWARHPTWVTRRGFPDKWFYDGERNRWVQPTPEPAR